MWGRKETSTVTWPAITRTPLESLLEARVLRRAPRMQEAPLVTVTQPSNVLCSSVLGTAESTCGKTLTVLGRVVGVEGHIAQFEIEVLVGIHEEIPGEETRRGHHQESPEDVP